MYNFYTVDAEIFNYGLLIIPKDKVYSGIDFMGDYLIFEKGSLEKDISEIKKHIQEAEEHGLSLASHIEYILSNYSETFSNKAALKRDSKGNYNASSLSLKILYYLLGIYSIKKDLNELIVDILENLIDLDSKKPIGKDTPFENLFLKTDNYGDINLDLQFIYSINNVTNEIKINNGIAMYNGKKFDMKKTRDTDFEGIEELEEIF